MQGYLCVNVQASCVFLSRCLCDCLFVCLFVCLVFFMSVRHTSCSKDLCTSCSHGTRRSDTTPCDQWAWCACARYRSNRLCSLRCPFMCAVAAVAAFTAASDAASYPATGHLHGRVIHRDTDRSAQWPVHRVGVCLPRPRISSMRLPVVLHVDAPVRSSLAVRCWW
jgi:hypothetical protein